MSGIVCTLCKNTFSNSKEFNEHEYSDDHRQNFEMRMAKVPINHLLCKCCYIPVIDLSAWHLHVKGSKHKKCQTHLTNAGKNCVWDVPGVKLENGSIKLCQTLNTLQDIGWVDPPLRRKLNQKPLSPTSVIGMNCVTMRLCKAKGDVRIQKYQCQLCGVDFDQTSLSHLSGHKHKINVIWNWDEALADRLQKLNDSPNKTKRDNFLVSLEEAVTQIFHLEQPKLNQAQREVYSNISGSVSGSGIERESSSSVDLPSSLRTLIGLSQGLVNYQTNMRDVPLSLDKQSLLDVIDNVQCVEDIMNTNALGNT